MIACTRFCNQPRIPTVGGTKNPDVAAIVALRPDVVVVDTEENRHEDADALMAAGLDVEVTTVHSLADALVAVDQLANAAGVVTCRMTDDVSAPAGERRRCFVPIWRRPWMSINADTYGASLLASIGLDVLTADVPERYPTVDLVAIAALDPDLVLVPSEPYTFRDAHVGELAAAFPDVSVVRVDGEDLFWWGIRTPAAQRRLAAQFFGAP